MTVDCEPISSVLLRISMDLLTNTLSGSGLSASRLSSTVVGGVNSFKLLLVAVGKVSFMYGFEMFDGKLFPIESTLGLGLTIWTTIKMEVRQTLFA
jgi:hypothetical protein